VHNTRKGQELQKLHRSLVDLISVINRPQHDEALIKEAGIALDRALFPLLVGIERFGPIGVVDLAERAGRDHTTVSRQVAKLERLRLVKRRASQGDRRVREATITNKGRVISDALDAARKRLATSILAQWSEHDLHDLVRLVSRFAGDALAWSSNQRAHDLQATRKTEF
jgi:DNA-binding MarR family transcriptional regulator